MKSRNPLMSPMTNDKVYGRQTVVEVVERKGMIVNTRKEGSPLIRQASLQEWRDWCKKFNAVVVI